MTKRIKSKKRIIRRFQEDFHGNLILNKRNKLTSLVLYKGTFFPKDISMFYNFKFNFQIKPYLYKKKKYASYVYLKKLLFRRYLGDIQKKQFNKTVRLRQKYSHADYFYDMIESRLDIFLLRLNFFPSVYFIRQYINHGNVAVNGILIKNAGYILNNNDKVTFFKKEDIIKYKKKLLFFLKKKQILTSYPKYMEINYKTMTFCFSKEKKLNTIEVPFKFSNMHFWDKYGLYKDFF
jgi:ribosomal protein S4